jgi:hypothetical protein
MTTELQKLLSNQAMQSLVKDLGIEGDTPEHQAEIMMMIGSNITKRLVLAFVNALPDSTHVEFETYIGSKDIDGLRTFLEKHIPDLDELIARESRAEFETTLAEAEKLQQ